VGGTKKKATVPSGRGGKHRELCWEKGLGKHQRRKEEDCRFWQQDRQKKRAQELEGGGQQSIGKRGGAEKGGTSIGGKHAAKRES